MQCYGTLHFVLPEAETIRVQTNIHLEERPYLVIPSWPRALTYLDHHISLSRSMLCWSVIQQWAAGNHTCRDTTLYKCTTAIVQSALLPHAHVPCGLGLLLPPLFINPAKKLAKASF